MTFTLWGREYRIRFSYTRHIVTGQRMDTYAWLEEKEPRAGYWDRMGTPGSAYLRFQSEHELAKEKQAIIAALPPAIRPVLRKQAIRTINAHYTNQPFNAEQGRKLALARFLKNLGWSKHDRKVVWHSYFDRFNAQQKSERLTRKQEEEMWDAYQQANTYQHEEVPF